ncbi:cholinesterase 2-like [Ruditapes philippinarum]|uniref:cholinesterase 2-like n=1 Tax=Ruditapes philippinarum TaxID=129788 RepID=UPI00295C37A7|nr:cholinesterase 2-like [Ruditapes philippinarum]
MLILHMLGFLSYFSFCVTQAPVYVSTKVGNIMGFQEHISLDGEQKMISKFFGIPFAEPTGGENRFNKPVQKAPFKGTFDARKEPAACYQQSAQDTSLRRIFGVSEFSEDCLTLNIYIPHEVRANNLRPVMIWIHGGGFTQGTALMNKPEGLALFGNVIVVTINYRLGMFGFLRDRNGVFPGNQGLWDQHLAIKWVHDHIDSFFGYKDEITIFGQSAGGASVIFQALYSGNAGLFKRVIAESGSAVAPWAIQKVTTYDEYFIDQGCSTTSMTFASCLQSKTPISIQSNITMFGPVIDGDFVVASPIDIINDNATNTARARDFFASLDIIVGANDKDGAGLFFSYERALNHTNIDFNISKDEFRNTLVPFIMNQILFYKEKDTKDALEKALIFFYTDWKNPDNDAFIRNKVADMTNDAAFFSPASQTVNAHAKLNVGKTFLYEFAVQAITHYISLPSWMKGTNHGEEMRFVFGLPLLANVSVPVNSSIRYSLEPKQVARATMAMWSNFAKSGINGRMNNVELRKRHPTRHLEN